MIVKNSPKKKARKGKSGIKAVSRNREPMARCWTSAQPY